MQKHREDKSVPLVGLGALFYITVIQGVRYSAEAAQVGESAVCHIDVGGVWTWPGDGRGAVLDSNNVMHAGHVSRTHVDGDIGRWADHWVELWMDFDGRASELC